MISMRQQYIKPSTYLMTFEGSSLLTNSVVLDSSKEIENTEEFLSRRQFYQTSVWDEKDETEQEQ